MSRPFATVLATALWISACTGGEKPASTRTPLRVGWQTTWATQGQLAVILEEEHLFEAQGFDVTFKGFSYGGPLNEAALAGEVDLLFTADQPALTLAARDPSFGLIARLMYNRVGLFVPVESPVQKTVQLKGRTLAVPFGAAAHRVALHSLHGAGLDEKSSVSVVNLGLEEIVALASGGAPEGRWGSVDAAATWDPTFADFEERGIVRTLATETVVAAVVLDDDLVHAHPDAPDRIRAALAEAYGRFRADPAAAHQRYLVRTGLPVTAAVLDRAATVEPNLHHGGSSTPVGSAPPVGSFMPVGSPEGAEATANPSPNPGADPGTIPGTSAPRLTFSAEDQARLQQAADFLVGSGMIDGPFDIARTLRPGATSP